MKKPSKLFLLALLIAAALVGCKPDPVVPEPDEPTPDEPTPDTLVPAAPQGILNGVFTVSDTLKVRFSQGNLQYQASTNTWRFAEHQTDCVGEGNANIGETYDGWIDLFGWGTSGYDHGAVAYQPWSTSTYFGEYYAYGSYRNGLMDQTGQAEWGYNAISNGGNEENSGWRTLRSKEWAYLLESRTTATGIRFATACVDGSNGLLLFPDEWDGSVNFNNPDHLVANFADNPVSATDWTSLQEAGVVFLPAAGIRVEGTQLTYIQRGGVYWSSTPCSDNMAYTMSFYYEGRNRSLDGNNREYGQSVRLVKNDN